MAPVQHDGGLNTRNMRSNAVSRSSQSSSRNIDRTNPTVIKKVVGQYVLNKDVGSGTFGKVKLAIHIPTGEKVAVKILEKCKIKDPGDVKRVQREIKILKRAKHENVVQLYEVLDTQNSIYLIMEWAEGGELFEYIVKHKRLAESQACYFFHQIINGLDSLHQSFISHRDLKPENILLKDCYGKLIVKIADFGLSNTYDGGARLITACGSPCYAPPEMIAGRRYDGALSDIWSIGVILFTMICGYLPFEEANTNQLYRKILAAEYKPAKWLSIYSKDLIRKILNVDPKKRYQLSDIRKHTWYELSSDRDIPTESLSEVENESVRRNAVYAMTTEGFDAKTAAINISARTFNSLTATYHLFHQKYRNLYIKHRSNQKPADVTSSSSSSTSDHKNSSSNPTNNSQAQASVLVSTMISIPTTVSASVTVPVPVPVPVTKPVHVPTTVHAPPTVSIHTTAPISSTKAIPASASATIPVPAAAIMLTPPPKQASAPQKHLTISTADQPILKPSPSPEPVMRNPSPRHRTYKVESAFTENISEDRPIHVKADAAPIIVAAQKKVLSPRQQSANLVIAKSPPSSSSNHHQHADNPSVRQPRYRVSESANSNVIPSFNIKPQPPLSKSIQVQPQAQDPMSSALHTLRQQHQQLSVRQRQLLQVQNLLRQRDAQAKSISIEARESSQPASTSLAATSATAIDNPRWNHNQPSESRSPLGNQPTSSSSHHPVKPLTVNDNCDLVSCIIHLPIISASETIPGPMPTESTIIELICHTASSPTATAAVQSPTSKLNISSATPIIDKLLLSRSSSRSRPRTTDQSPSHEEIRRNDILSSQVVRADTLSPSAIVKIASSASTRSSPVVDINDIAAAIDSDTESESDTCSRMSRDSLEPTSSNSSDTVLDSVDTVDDIDVIASAPVSQLSQPVTVTEPVIFIARPPEQPKQSASVGGRRGRYVVNATGDVLVDLATRVAAIESSSPENRKSS